ncbi:hypothetical protein SFRURICE_003223 [Spodoptera frugiperda]|nr:hypothetical protein SFRURICE_003223 [Spodoptera frugiperda]
MLEAHIHEQHSATHDAAIVALLLRAATVEFLVKTIRDYNKIIFSSTSSICIIGEVLEQVFPLHCKHDTLQYKLHSRATKSTQPTCAHSKMFS